MWRGEAPSYSVPLNSLHNAHRTDDSILFSLVESIDILFLESLYMKIIYTNIKEIQIK